jgi:hypothetical protein
MAPPNNTQEMAGFHFGMRSAKEWVCAEAPDISLYRIDGRGWGVNWPACGTVSIDRALSVGRAIVAAAQLASKLNNPPLDGGMAPLDGGMATLTIGEGGQWITTRHPYDLANYHWAHSRDGEQWDIYRDVGFGSNHRRHLIGTIRERDPEHVVAALREHDKSVCPMMDRT